MAASARISAVPLSDLRTDGSVGAHRNPGSTPDGALADDSRGDRLTGWRIHVRFEPHSHASCVGLVDK
jgi:hypothetical protein